MGTEAIAHYITSWMACSFICDTINVKGTKEGDSMAIMAIMEAIQSV